MSVFGALDTAVSGLSAESLSFSNIGNNIANSQTVGYKATDTDFSDFVLSSTNSEGNDDTVRATTSYQNEAQGTITASTNTLALAISGRGFFSVAEENGGSSSNTPSFQNTAYYTRNGNFTENNAGYLVNSSNEYLNGYAVDPGTGALNTSKLQTINVANIAFRPTATTTVTDTANLPSDAAVTAGKGATDATSQTTTVYDSSGKSHSLNLSWTSQGNSSWTVSATVDGAATPSSTAQVQFDPTGAINSITPAGGTANTTGGTNASFAIPAGAAGSGLGAITVNLGQIGSTSATSQATAGGAGAATTATTDSVTSGTLAGITISDDGSVLATFQNKDTEVSQLVAKVPLAMFASPDALSSQDGEAFTATSGSGQANLTLAGENGAGNLQTSSLEGSTTDLDTDLAKLITAQNAYGANAKVVTTANEMLQTALSMKQ